VKCTEGKYHVRNFPAGTEETHESHNQNGLFPERETKQRCCTKDSKGTKHCLPSHWQCVQYWKAKTLGS